MPFDDHNDDEDLVPLGDALGAINEQRTGAAQQAAREVLRSDYRTPPSALDAERAVLGAMLLSQDVIDGVIGEGLRPEHMYRKAHGLVFAAILALRARGEPVDVLTVMDELQQTKKLEEAGGGSGLAHLEAMLPTVAHAETYARLVREKAILREVIALSSDAVGAAFAQDRPTAQVVEELRQGLGRLEDQGTSGIVDNKTIISRVRSRMPALGGTRVVVPTGLTAVDTYLSGGVEPGDLVIVAARPSMGKTQFILDWADHIAMKRRRKVLIFSLEMGAEQLMQRMAGVRADLDTRRHHFNHAERHRIEEVLEDLSNSPLRIDDRPGIGLGAITARARSEARDGTLELIIIDYLTLIAMPTEKGGNRDTAIGVITRGLKILARQLGVPVIALSQLSRGVESRPNKRPMMSDLRESGNIEQDADIIAMLYREEYYERERTPEDKRGIAEFIVAKNRNGAAGGCVRLRFTGAGTPRFSSTDDGDDPWGGSAPAFVAPTSSRRWGGDE